MDTEQLVREALRQYGLTGAEISFLRHNENAVYRVDMPDGRRYSLRLHMPADSLNQERLMQRPAWIESEMRFLQALDLESPVEVQSPLCTVEGALVAQLPGGQGCATMLSWIPGKDFDPSAEDAEAMAYQVGMLAARMHDFVQTHPALRELERPSYDAQYIRGSVMALQEGVGLGILPQETYEALLEYGDVVGRLIDADMQRPGAHGLIHNDLGLGNLIVHDEHVSPIDFSLCGFAPFLFDLGGLMGTFNTPELRRSTFTGYESLRPIPEASYPLIEGCFIGGIVLFMALHLTNPHVREWFSRRLPAVMAEYVVPFCKGESFLFQLMDKQA